MADVFGYDSVVDPVSAHQREDPASHVDGAHGVRIGDGKFV
jgi:hypothetical protein